MAEGSGTRLALAVGALALVLAGGGFALWTLAPGAPNDGPAEVAWDREVCTWCHMHVSEPAYAAQVRVADGSARFFDDPGCVFAWKADRERDVAQTWFHHVDEDRWIPADEVTFAERSPTPMGYGLGAVDRAAGEIPLAEARRRVMKQLRGDGTEEGR